MSRLEQLKAPAVIGAVELRETVREDIGEELQREVEGLLLFVRRVHELGPGAVQTHERSPGLELEGGAPGKGGPIPIRLPGELPADPFQRPRGNGRKAPAAHQLNRPRAPIYRRQTENPLRLRCELRRKQKCGYCETYREPRVGPGPHTVSGPAHRCAPMARWASLSWVCRLSFSRLSCNLRPRARARVILARPFRK